MERYHAMSLLSLTARHPARAQRRSPRAGDGSDRLSAHGTLPPLRYTFDDGLNAISRQPASTAQTQLRTACLADRDNRAVKFGGNNHLLVTGAPLFSGRLIRLPKRPVARTES